MQHLLVHAAALPLENVKFKIFRAAISQSLENLKTWPLPSFMSKIWVSHTKESTFVAQNSLQKCSALTV